MAAGSDAAWRCLPSRLAGEGAVSPLPSAQGAPAAAARSLPRRSASYSRQSSLEHVLHINGGRYPLHFALWPQEPDDQRYLHRLTGRFSSLLRSWLSTLAEAQRSLVRPLSN